MGTSNRTPPGQDPANEIRADIGSFKLNPDGLQIQSGPFGYNFRNGHITTPFDPPPPSEIPKPDFQPPPQPTPPNTYGPPIPPNLQSGTAPSDGPANVSIANTDGTSPGFYPDTALGQFASDILQTNSPVMQAPMAYTVREMTNDNSPAGPTLLTDDAA